VIKGGSKGRDDADGSIGLHQRAAADDYCPLRWPQDASGDFRRGLHRDAVAVPRHVCDGDLGLPSGESSDWELMRGRVL